MKTNRKTDILIIGAGPAGYVAAIYAAKKGKKVILVDGLWVGGTCLNAGCIPTKALVKSAELYQEILASEEKGISVKDLKLDLNKIIDNKDSIKDKLVNGIKFLLEKYQVEVIEAYATFLNNKEVLIKDKDLVLTADDILIATGSKTKHLPVEGIDNPLVLDSEKILELRTLPKTLTVIGGGIIGMEFAFIYANLGVKVNVIEFLPRILMNLDREFSLRLIRFAKQLNIDIYTNSEVKRLEGNNKSIKTYFVRKNQEEYLESDYVLEAVGRGPNINGLGLENTDVIFDSRSGIKVDEQLRTNVDNIYAIGDVNNIMQLAHVASHQAIVAVDSILGKNHKINYDLIPSVVFTSPTIATVGISEEKAKERSLDYEVVKVPFSANGKAIILDSEAGFIKLLREKSTKKLIGAQIFGKEAENLIATYTLAITNNLTAGNIKDTVFAHPTIQELVHESALGLEKEAIHFVD
ncbi:MAG: dihydrolipoyl dehydrogenase [Candidatus Izemoplasmatales bacterium]